MRFRLQHTANKASTMCVPAKFRAVGKSSHCIKLDWRWLKYEIDRRGKKREREVWDVEDTDTRANNLHSRSPNCTNLLSNSTMEEDDGLVRWKPYGEKEIIFSVNFAATILVGICLVLLPCLTINVPRLLTHDCCPRFKFRSSSNSRFLKSIFPKLGARNRIYEDY